MADRPHGRPWGRPCSAGFSDAACADACDARTCVRHTPFKCCGGIFGDHLGRCRVAKAQATRWANKEAALG